MLLFDGDKNVGPIYPLHPFFPADMNVEALAAVPPISNPIPLGQQPSTTIPLRMDDAPNKA
jgi:ubiquitin-like 1-activating enzyme E1 A